MHKPVLVAAETRPRHSASTAVLKRVAFELANAVEHPDDGLLWEWKYRAASTV